MAHDLNNLVFEAPKVVELLGPYWSLHDENQIRDCDMVALFILCYFSLRRHKRWCSSYSKNPLCGEFFVDDVVSMKLADLDAKFLDSLGLDYIAKKFKHSSLESTKQLKLVDIFKHLTFSAIKHNSDNYINKFMVLWYSGKRPVRLLNYVPTPYEVLTQQAHGERVVTMFKTLEELSRHHTSKLNYMSGLKEHDRDPLEFLLHDIRHMEHFINPDSHHEQVGFFHCLFQINEGKLKRYFLDVLGYEKSLWFEMEYVISDMNCFSTHLLRYLHAKWLSACKLKMSYTMSLNHSDSSNSEYAFRCQAQIEWQSIVNQMFTVAEFDMQDIDARELAEKLNDISFHIIHDLADSDWQIIREWFTSVGKHKLELLR